MTLPADLSTFTLRGKYKDFRGNPRYGNGESVTIVYPIVVNDASEHTVLTPTTIVQPLDSTGSFSIVIPVTEDPDMVPSSFPITVKENFINGRVLTFNVPDGTDTIYIDEMAPGSPPNLGTIVYATFASLQAEKNARMAADSTLTTEMASAQTSVTGMGVRVTAVETSINELGTTYVALAGNQTIDGVKTFDSIPVLPSSDPTSDNQSTRKRYVTNLISAAIATAMLLTGSQSVDGTKIFTSFPVGPSAPPTADYQFANKKFVEDTVAGGGGGSTVLPGVIMSNLVGDGVTLGDANCTASSTTVTMSTTHPFVSGDVNKKVLIYRGDSTSICTFVGHITAVNSSNSIEVDRAVPSTVANTMLCFGTDETAIFQADIDRAEAYALLHGGKVKLQVPAAAKDHFVLAGPLLHTGQGNSQIVIPVWATTGPKLVLEIAGATDGSATQHWETVLPNVGGSTFVSYFTYASTSAQDVDINANGHSSVIGGPTEPSGYTQSAKFNNVQCVLSNMQIRTTHTQDGIGIGAAFLASCASGGVERFGWGSMSTVALHIDSVGNYGNGEVIGLYLPTAGNNDLSYASNATCHGGYTYDIWVSEHTDFFSTRLLYGWAGLCVIGNYWSSVGTTHGVNGFLSIEGCNYFLYLIGAGSGGEGPYLHLVLDTEGTLKVGDRTGGVASLSVTGQLYLMGEVNASTFTTDYPVGFDIILANTWYPNKGVSANWTVDTFTKLVVVDATSGNVVLGLPTSDGRSKPITVVLGATASGHTVTLDPAGTETINGATTVVLNTLWDRIRVEPYAHNWVQTA